VHGWFGGGRLETCSKSNALAAYPTKAKRAKYLNRVGQLGRLW